MKITIYICKWAYLCHSHNRHYLRDVWNCSCNKRLQTTARYNVNFFVFRISYGLLRGDRGDFTHYFPNPARTKWSADAPKELLTSFTYLTIFPNTKKTKKWNGISWTVGKKTGVKFHINIYTWHLHFKYSQRHSTERNTFNTTRLHNVTLNPSHFLHGCWIFNTRRQQSLVTKNLH